jgi:hypothetical protein
VVGAGRLGQVCPKPRPDLSLPHIDQPRLGGIANPVQANTAGWYRHAL